MTTINQQAVLLTVTQKIVLAVLFNAPTPEVAYENINGNVRFITARNVLERLGYVVVSANRAALTDSGRNAVVTNNIADPSGVLTPDDETLIKQGGLVSESAFPYLVTFVPDVFDAD